MSEGTNDVMCNENEKERYEYVYSPEHYHKYDIETVDIIDKIVGHFVTAQWCKWNAFKYRMRVGNKPNTDTKTDFDKEKEYLWMYKDYITKSRNEQIDFDTLTEDMKEYIARVLCFNSTKIQRYMTNNNIGVCGNTAMVTDSKNDIPYKSEIKE